MTSRPGPLPEPERYRLIAENASDCIWTTDLELRFTYISPAITRLRGFTVEEAMAQTVDQVLTPASLAQALEQLREGLSSAETVNPILTTLWEEYRKDGSTIWVESELSLIRDAEGRPVEVLGVSRDVTARKRAEDALRESEERFRTMVDMAPDAIFIADASGRLVEANHTAAHQLGIPRSQLVGKRLLDLVAPAALAHVWAKLQGLTAEGTLESLHLRSDGQEVPVELAVRRISFRGEPAVLAIARDIAARKRAEVALIESERRFRELADLLPQTVFEADQAGRFTFANQHGLEAFGYRREELEGLGIAAVIAPEDHARVVEWLRSPRRSNSGGTEYLMRRRDGTTFPVVAHADRIVREGRVLGVRGVLVDISRIKQAAQALRESEERLQQSQKMEAVGRLAGGVAHDFNNILTSLIGYTEMLLGQLHADDPLYADLLEVRRAGERAASITSQLLAFSRKQLIAPRVIDLNEVVAGATRMLQRLIGEDIELSFQPAPELGRVKADPSQLEQVLVNLAVNARDAMPDGGRLQIETAEVQLDEAACAGRDGVTPGRYVRLSAIDGGRGISADILPHIFEPFFTTKEGKGTGLGLSTVYGIVKQNGGFITVASEPGAGASFHVHLPRLQASAAAVPAPPVEAPRGGSETVLLVEDEEMVRRLTRRVLERFGYRVLSAAGAAEAVDVAREHAAPIHLLLTDIVLPKTNGRLLWEELRRARPELRVLFMSGYTDDVIAQHGVLEEGIPFLQKPFSIEALTRKVREALC